ncbi:MAG TPA: YfiR family protein [Cytophagaceae bacterium]|jgi:hypothetical protein|nr:YfiR family protein [Cytophagaceae bacterium]
MTTKFNKFILLITTAVCMLSLTTKAQNINYKVHALFLYKFTQYIEWPASNNSYVIGVVGNSPILEELQNLALTRKNLVIKKLTASSDLSGCQVVFVSENSSSQLSSLSAKLSGKPVLVISETGSGAKKGAGINFVMVDDKMKFELNKSTVEHQGLKVSGDLVTLSIIVG